MIRRPPRSTLFPTRRSSDLARSEIYLLLGRVEEDHAVPRDLLRPGDRKSTRLNFSHPSISYAVFCLKKKNLPTRTPGIDKLIASACRPYMRRATDVEPHLRR